MMAMTETLVATGSLWGRTISSNQSAEHKYYTQIVAAYGTLNILHGKKSVGKFPFRVEG